MRRFLEGISSPSAEKNGEADAGASYASRCDVFQKTFRYLRRKNGDAGTAALCGGKRKRTVLPSWQTGRPWLIY